MTKHWNFKNLPAAILCLLTTSFFALAQVPDPNNPDQKILPDQFSSNDSLNAVEIEPSQVVDSMTEAKISFADVDVPIFEDSIYETRLKNINSSIPLDYNQEVRNYIDLYVLKRRSQVERMIALSKFYYPIFDQIFAPYSVPPEMKNLAIVESALNPHAISKAGATGIWQFMYGTAKMYGMSMNNYVDDRRDIIRSTEGAAQYLSSMYNVYGDWLLAIASYNCGPQNVNRAIQRSGKNTFWGIRDYLPKETRGYVPAFIAATYVMNYYDLHDLEPRYEALAHCFDSIAVVSIDDKMSCEQIARYTNMSIDEVKFLNPGLRCSVIPGLEQPYAFKMPSDRADMFDLFRDSIILYSTDAKQQYYYGSTPGSGRVYVVKKGDNLGKIASRYHVSVSQIKKWNHLRSTVIRPGQKLKIYSSRYEEAVASSNTNSKTQSGNTTASTTSSKNSASNTSTNPNSALTGKSAASSTDAKATHEAKYIYYKARYGDTLWDIARKHGTTVEKIKDLNGPSKCNNLKAGTVLKISSKG